MTSWQQMLPLMSRRQGETMTGTSGRWQEKKGDDDEGRGLRRICVLSSRYVFFFLHCSHSTNDLFTIRPCKLGQKQQLPPTPIDATSSFPYHICTTITTTTITNSSASLSAMIRNVPRPLVDIWWYTWDLLKGMPAAGCNTHERGPDDKAFRHLGPFFF